MEVGRHVVAALVLIGMSLPGVGVEASDLDHSSDMRSGDTQRGPTVLCKLQPVAEQDGGHQILDVPAPDILISHETQEVFMYIYMDHQSARIGGNALSGQMCWSPDDKEVVKFYFPVAAKVLSAPIPHSMQEANVRLCTRSSSSSVMCFNGQFSVYDQDASVPYHSKGGDPSIAPKGTLQVDDY